MAQNRLDRELESRTKTARKKSWSRPETLPEVDVGAGWVPRWVRISTLGTSDATNISSKIREGWEPVRAEDHPEIFSDAVADARFKDNVIIGGLMLCKAPAELVQERSEYYKQVTDSQMQSVDNNLMRENDPRMPLFHDRKTKVTFGSGK